jgi:hypothetical protein
MDDKLSKFVAEFRRVGSPEMAYRNAGYQGNAAVEAPKLLRSKAVQAMLATTNIELPPTATPHSVDRGELDTKEGLIEWLISAVEGKIDDGEYVDKEGRTHERPASLKDRLKAVELISKFKGYMAPTEIQQTSTEEVFHFVTVDNGRAVNVVLPQGSPKLLD